MLFIFLTLRQICVFEFFGLEGGANFMKHLMGGGASYKSLGTFELTSQSN
jgi:hypothetical protein